MKRELRCFDNNGKTFDRYTIVPPRWAKDEFYNERLYGHSLFNAIAASEHPFHPQGFGQHTSARVGSHLGKRVPFVSLPPDVQQFAHQRFPQYAPERATTA